MPGMGIDKPNIRHLYHYSVPATLESYYQQAGRAGRDGLPSTCTLFWGHGDIATQDTIKEPGSLKPNALKSYLLGIKSMQVWSEIAAHRLQAQALILLLSSAPCGLLLCGDRTLTCIDYLL